MKKNKKILSVSIVLTVLLACFLISGCATSASSTQRQNIYREIDEAISRNDFDSALQLVILAQAEARPLYDANNAISLWLNKGLLEFYAGHFEDSANSLLNAERLIQEAYTRSVTQNVATYILNDNSREYPGEDFEDIYLSVFNALNFYHQDNIEGALVEVRKLTLPSGKLELLSRKYDEANARAKGSSIDEAEMREAGISDIPTETDLVSVSFINSALARYLSILFYQADRNEDAVRIELEQLRLAFASQPSIYNHSFPTNTIENIVEVPPGQARLDVLSFIGMSPIKEERLYEQYFPFFRDPALQRPQFRLPVLVDRPNRIDRIEIVIGDERINLELLENMGAVVRDTFQARYATIFLKTYLRTMAKYTALQIMSNEIESRTANSNLVTKTAARVGFIAAIAAFEATESADIRMSRFLPNRAYIGSIILEPGTYDVTVNYYSGRNLVQTKTNEAIEVRAGRLNFEQFSNLDFMYAYTQGD